MIIKKWFKNIYQNIITFHHAGKRAQARPGICILPANIMICFQLERKIGNTTAKFLKNHLFRQKEHYLDAL